ncbi:MAG: hypothetical protein HQL09_05095 [Nitrospirae bacterium]|nr:hypothetical protein [Nitrospirota bacterium]
MNNMHKIGKYLIIALMAVLAVYGVLFPLHGRSARTDEADLERNVARNAQYPQLVGVGPRAGAPYGMNRSCPRGAAQFTGGDYNCNFCHRLADAAQNLSDATHHYTNIAGQNPLPNNPAASQSGEPFPDPQPPGYAVALPTATAQAPPVMWGAKPPHVQRGICTDCHEVVFPGVSAQSPPIKWGARPPHGKRGICTDCHKVI